MQASARRWFLIWGLLIAVFRVRGLLPWLIVWVMTPGLGPWDAFTASLTGDPAALKAIQDSSPVLLMGRRRIFHFSFLSLDFSRAEKIRTPWRALLRPPGSWFFAVVSIAMTVIVWYALDDNPMMAFGAVVGSTAFFITHGFKRYAEEQEARMLSGEAPCPTSAKSSTWK